ncbi:MAG TPA: DUF4365 domain-containing protein [Longimicrobium sp.]|jgi:hypothetical protein
MSEVSSRMQVVARRGELLAEFFLEDFAPALLARPSADLGFDYLMGLPNSEGGMNLAGVQVKATDRPVPSRMPVSREMYDRMAHSNVPVLLLVVDVKRNLLYYADSDARVDDGGTDRVVVQLTEVDESVKQELRDRLCGLPEGAAAA